MARCWYAFFTICFKDILAVAKQVELAPSGIAGIAAGAPGHRKLIRAAESPPQPYSLADLQSGPQQCGASAQCNPYSDRPCCSLQGECGISQAHCGCKGCVDVRQVVGRNAVKAWHADVWKNACGQSSMATDEDGARLGSIMKYCPSCLLGHFAIPTSDTENMDISGPDAAKKHADDSKWGFCRMDWPDGQSGNRQAPRSVWRIDVLSTEVPKAPLIRWPCTSYGYLQHTGATVATRGSIAYWARLMSSASPGLFDVENTLDIGSNVGSSALHMALAATGRTLAIEMLEKNFEILDFFAGMNPDLRIEPLRIAFAPADGKVDFLENDGCGRVTLFGSKTGLPAVRPVPLLEKTYGSAFIEKLSFVNLAVEGQEAAILRALKPLTERSMPAIHVEWHEEYRQKCGARDNFVGGSLELLNLVKEMGYVAHHPDDGSRIDAHMNCTDFQHGPTNLLLVPAASIERLGDLAFRWAKS